MPQCQFLFIMSIYCRKGPKMKVLGKIWKNHRNYKRPEDPGSQKGSQSSATGWPHPPQAWARPGRAWAWWAHSVHLPASPLRLFIPSESKTLNESASIHETFRSSAAVADKIGGQKVSVLAPYRDGELPPEPSPSTSPPSPSPLLPMQSNPGILSTKLSSGPSDSDLTFC